MRISDWSSDVCSSDLRQMSRAFHANCIPPQPGTENEPTHHIITAATSHALSATAHTTTTYCTVCNEVLTRKVSAKCRTAWSPILLIGNLHIMLKARNSV